MNCTKRIGNSYIRKIIAALTAIAMILTLMPAAKTVSAADTIDISKNIVITAGNVTNYNNRVLTGSRTDATLEELKYDTIHFREGYIVVDGTTVNLTINSISIDFSERNALISGIALKNKATLNLTIVGNNKIQGANFGGAGINVPDGCTLNITKESTGTLIVNGGNAYGGGAGIGAISNKYNAQHASGTTSSCGTISINGGTVNATGGGNVVTGDGLIVVGGFRISVVGAAGIGNAAIGNDDGVADKTGRITINGGVVTAKGGVTGAGIGGGLGMSVSSITINGGVVKAYKGEGSGAAIGCGGYADRCGTLSITGGKVTVDDNIGYSNVSECTGSVSVGDVLINTQNEIAPLAAGTVKKLDIQIYNKELYKYKDSEYTLTLSDGNKSQVIRGVNISMNSVMLASVKGKVCNGLNGITQAVLEDVNHNISVSIPMKYADNVYSGMYGSPDRYISALNLGNVKPELGKAPVANIETDGYIGSVVWKNDTEVVTEFVCETRYNAEVTIYPKDYSVVADSVTCADSSWVIVKNANNTITATKTFGKTANHSYASGVCTCCGCAMKDYLKPSTTGYYLLSYNYQLKWFAAAVNSGIIKKSSNASLRKDIDMSAINDYQGINGFTGIFSGNGYTISNLNGGITNPKAKQYSGLFVTLGTKGTVKKVVLKNCRAAYDGAAGNLVCINNGKIENCVVRDSKIYGMSDNMGYLVGTNNSSGSITNCVAYNSEVCCRDNGMTTDKLTCDFGGITAENNGAVKDCLVYSPLAGGTGTVGGIIAKGSNAPVNSFYCTSTNRSKPSSTDGQAVTASQIESGEASWLINGSNDLEYNWGYSIGSDSFPLPSYFKSPLVYKCDTGYTNTASHTYEDGICTKCGEPLAGYMSPVSGVYKIENENQLCWFSAYMNCSCTHTAVNAVLTADIDMDGRQWVPIASKAVNGSDARAYTGTFDGKGHVISNLNHNNNGTHYGFIRMLGTGGSVRNTTFQGADVFYQDIIGCAVVAHNNYGTIEKCMVIGSSVQLGNYAGLGVIAGRNYGTIIGCGAAGNTLQRRFRGVNNQNIGCIAEINNNGTIKDCFSYGNTMISGKVNGGITASVSSDGCRPVNCYYYTASATSSSVDGISKLKTSFKLGEVTCLLNGTLGNAGTGNSTWYQNLTGTSDEYPVLDTTHGTVYYINMVCTNDANAAPGAYEKLQYLIMLASEVLQNSGSYTTASSNTFEEAYAAAVNIDANSGDSKVLTAYIDLKTAFDSLELASSVIVVNSNPVNSGILAGGGRYADVDTVRISAKAVSGYTFSGWYKGTDETAVYSVEPELEYTPASGENVTFTAKYEANENKNLSIITENGVIKYSYNDNSGTYTESFEDRQYAKGTYMTIDAVANEDYTFLYWIDSSTGKILSDSTRYSFCMSDHKQLKACYTQSEDEASYVVFKDMNGKILWSGDVSNGQAASAPEHGIYIGYTFAGWDTDFTCITHDMVVTAQYDSLSGYKLNVTNGTILNEKDSYSYGSLVTVTADEQKDGRYFSGWYMTGVQSGDRIVSDKMKYSFYINGSINIEARYNGDEVLVEQLGINLFMSDRIVTQDSKNTVKITAEWSIPGGYTIVEAGIIRTLNDEYRGKLTLADIDNVNVKKSASSLTTSNGTYGVTLMLGGTSYQKNVYARGYVTYCDNVSGRIQTVYTDVYESRPAE